MGRRRVHRLDLPRRVYEKHGSLYYWPEGGKWERLGPKTDISACYRRLAELRVDAPRCTSQRRNRYSWSLWNDRHRFKHGCLERP